MSQNLPITAEELPDALYIELAVGVRTDEDIFSDYKLSPSTIRRVTSDPVFQRRLREAKVIVDDDGTAFRARAKRVISDEGLLVMRNHLVSPDTPASVKHDIFKTLARLAGFDNQKSAEAPSGPTFVFEFHTTSPEPNTSMTIDITPTTTDASTTPSGLPPEPLSSAFSPE